VQSECGLRGDRTPARLSLGQLNPRSKQGSDAHSGGLKNREITAVIRSHQSSIEVAELKFLDLRLKEPRIAELQARHQSKRATE
jgi:hypothetical protein